MPLVGEQEQIENFTWAPGSKGIVQSVLIIFIILTPAFHSCTWYVALGPKT